MALSLLLSLAVSAGNLRLAATGHADIFEVGIRYTVAFLVAFVAVGIIGRVFNDYLDGIEARRAEGADAGDGPDLDSMRLAEE
jgi:hypothetical protein